MRGVVLDPETRRYSRLKEASCVALSSRALGIPAENHARFGMTSEKGRVVMEREIPAHAEGEAALIGFGGNDIDYDWRAVAADPHAEHLPHTPPKRFCENMRAMVCLARSRGMESLLMTLPPIDAVRYYEWIGRDIEGKENILVWLGDVQQIYCALPGFVDSKNEEKTERNAGYLVVSHSGGGMLRQGTRKGIRRTPANRGMRAHWVVKGLDISEDVCHGMCP